MTLFEIYLNVIYFLTAAHMVFIGIAIAFLYLFPLPWRFTVNFTFAKSIGFLVGTIGFLKGIKAFLIAFVALTYFNQDHHTVERVGDVEYVYAIVGSFCICFVGGTGLLRLFRDKYSLEKVKKTSKKTKKLDLKKQDKGTPAPTLPPISPPSA